MLEGTSMAVILSTLEVVLKSPKPKVLSLYVYLTSIVTSAFCYESHWRDRLDLSISARLGGI